MSLSPGFPQGAPTLAEVLLSRTFARPPQPFVDGEFLEALEHADDAPPVTVAIARPPAGGQAADGGDGAPGAPAPSSAAPAPASGVDVRV
jgi:hypothetical protein